MIFSKQNAQYFAMAIEETIDSLINNTEINYSNIEKASEVFTEENKEQFLIDATNIINNYFSTAKKSIYSGRSTKNAIADFIIDNQIRATFAWQNGTPLNNPTIRIFFK